MNNPRRIQRHLVKALAAGALLAAAALPLAIASVAGAAGTPPVLTSVAFTPHGAAANSFGAGSTGTVALVGTGFINDGGAVTVASTCTGSNTITWSNEVETSTTTATASYSDSGSAAGTCTVTIADDNSSTASNTVAATIDAAPDPSSISPATLWDASAPTTVTIAGSGFATGATVAFVSTVNGTSLTSSVTSVSASSIVLSVTPTNSVNGTAATAGTYNVVITNTDGGVGSLGAGFTIGNGLENLSPSALPATAGSYTVALLGSGFQYGATITLTTGQTNLTACTADITSITTTITSPTAGSAVVVVAASPSNTVCGLTLTNTGTGNNGAVFSLPNALGIGETSIVAPVITSSSSTTPITAGSAASTVTLTGSGFSSFTTLATAPQGITYGAPTATGTTLTFSATVGAGGSSSTDATAGPVAVTAKNGAATTTFTPAITVAGPVVTSQAPNLVVGEAFGSTVVLTGTGFTNTTTGAVNNGGGTFRGTVSYASATTMNLVVTTTPSAADISTAPTVTLTQTSATGQVLSAAFPLTVDAAPSVTGLVTYKTGADVGVGATAQTVYIHGLGFETGATVGTFINGAGTADPDVTATVTAVTPTQITATIAVAAGDLNTAVGYTVTNTDGGTTKVAAFAYPILIAAGPTITSVTPTAGKAGTTTSFAVAGTNFETGAVVTLSPANGTCTAPTITATTTLAATCTLGQPSSAATYLVVTNPDGGSATSTTAVLPAATTAAAFHVSGVHGAAVVGKTVTITISGTGFYGQPKITSTAVGSKFGVSKDNGRLLTVRATIKAGTKAGEHTLTVKLADGKSGKAGFDIKK